MKWFRMYYEARNDAKLDTLSDAEHRVWFRLLCLAAEQRESRGQIRKARFLLAVEVAGGDTTLLDRTLGRLSDLGIVAVEADIIRFIDARPFERGRPERPSRADWSVLRSTVFRRDDFRCRYCGARGGRLECDHIVPVAAGGGHELSNLATACFRCNRSKRSRRLEDWRR